MKFYILDGDDWCEAYTENGKKIYEGHSRSEARSAITDYAEIDVEVVDTEEILDSMELTEEQKEPIDMGEGFYIAQEEFEKRFLNGTS